MPALGVDVVVEEDFVFAPSDLLVFPLLPLAVVLLLIMLLMKISLMSISAAEALLSKGVVELPLTLSLSAGADSVAAVLLLAVTLTLADGLLGVLMVVTLVAIPPLVALILFIVAGNEDGGVGGPL